jgi:hypothetical protein
MDRRKTAGPTMSTAGGTMLLAGPPCGDLHRRAAQRLFRAALPRCRPADTNASDGTGNRPNRTCYGRIRAGSSVAEQGTFNPLVVGSNPTRLTTISRTTEAAGNVPTASRLPLTP